MHVIDLTNGLSFVDVQLATLAEFKSTLNEFIGRHSTEKQVELIARAKASRLAATRAQHSVSLSWTLSHWRGLN
jgi:hypothetical protein